MSVLNGGAVRRAASALVTLTRTDNPAPLLSVASLTAECRRPRSGKSGLSHLRDLRVHPSRPRLSDSVFPAKWRLPMYPKMPNLAERGIPRQYKVGNQFDESIEREKGQSGL